MEEKELIKLIDKYLDEALTVDETEELNDLLENSREFRDLFRSRVRLHGDLASHYDSMELPVLSFKPQKNHSRALVTIALSLAAALLISLFLPRQMNSQNAPVLAKLALNKSTQLKSQGMLVVDDSLTHGTYSFSQGIIELEMPHDVTVAVEGPAIFSLLGERKMSLMNGRVSAHVGEAGKGFIVETPDGNIVDLGTRFGVSVSDGGKTEAHVFQGKINVVANSKTTQLLKDEAVQFSEDKSMKIINADSARFPLPGFPLDIHLDNSSYEEPTEFLVGWPQVPSAWGGDHCEMVNYTQEVEAFDGTKMLSFVQPYAKGAANEGQEVSQIWQLVDLQNYSEEIKRGSVSACLSAHFNTNEDALNGRFSLSMYAFSGKIKAIKQYWDNKKDPLSELLGSSNTGISTDGNPTTWEKVENQLNIPAGTTFLLVQLTAKSKDSGFNGYFADGVRLEVATEARMSVPSADWIGNGGMWHRRDNWQDGKLPDFNRQVIRLKSTEPIIIDHEVTLKQPLVLALHVDSEAHLQIAADGVLNQTANGELLVGYNTGGKASIVVEGILRTRKKAFIGRNNRQSSVIIDGGLWDAKNTEIRMSQYGSREVSTQSLIEIKNGGQLIGKALNMIFDDSVVELVDGTVELERLQIGGDDGSAIVNHHSGRLKVDRLSFGGVKGLYYFAGRDAQLFIKGKWTVEKLFQMANSNFYFQGEELSPEQLQVQMETSEEGVYSVFSLK